MPNLRAVTSLTALTNDSPQPFPNIDFVGMGVKIYEANPRPLGSESDPGFRSPVFDLTGSEHETADHRYIVPDGVNTRLTTSCDSDFSYSDIAGKQSYQSYLHTYAKADISGYGASFTGSEECEEVHKKTSEYNTVFTYLEMVCSVYEAHIEIYDHPPFTNGFINAVNSLPPQFNSSTQDAYFRMIEAYGTHFAYQVYYGGRFGQQSEISNSSWSTMSSSNLNVQTAASCSALSSSAAVETMTEYDVSQSEEYQKYVVVSHNYSIGGRYPSNGDLSEWQEACEEDPMPLSYELYEITDMMTPTDFPDDENIDMKKNSYKQATIEYCYDLLDRGLISSCDVPPPDPPFPPTSIFGGMYSHTGSSSFKPNPYTGQASCGNEYTAYQVGYTSKICGEGSAEKTYLCLLSDKSVDPLDEFGGIYQVGTTTLNNPMTGNTTCAEGYDAIKMSHGSNGEMYYCYKPTNVLGYTPWAGFYQSGAVEVPNYFSLTASCGGSGYEAYKIAETAQRECEGGANIYVCLNNVFVA